MLPPSLSKHDGWIWLQLIGCHSLLPDSWRNMGKSTVCEMPLADNLNKNENLGYINYSRYRPPLSLNVICHREQLQGP